MTFLLAAQGDGTISLALLVVALVALIAAVLVYFLPTAIASQRNHSNTVGVFVVNLVFGWSLIGWIVALVWALQDQPREI